MNSTVALKTIRFVKTAALAMAWPVLAVTSVSADTYSWENLQSDIAGVAEHVDANLVNPWGMAPNSTGTVIWVSNNGTGTSTLYTADGTANSLVVTVPGKARREPGNPTGMVRNGTTSFNVTKNGVSGPARFIWVSEDGTISGWNPTVDPTNAIVAVTGNGSNVYKGVTLGVANGHNFLYATNFKRGRVDVFDENFHAVNMAFADSSIPQGFAPFGIRNFNGEIFVTYAKQSNDKRDDVPGPGNGFINVFNTNGNLLRHLVSHGNLNSPWGLTLIKGDELWVGNFGDGKINNYDSTTGAFLETISRADGSPLVFDGLWDLISLGDGVYFTAGIADEEHGLFGLITED